MSELTLLTEIYLSALCGLIQPNEKKKNNFQNKFLCHFSDQVCDNAFSRYGVSH